MKRVVNEKRFSGIHRRRNRRIVWDIQELSPYQTKLSYGNGTPENSAKIRKNISNKTDSCNTKVTFPVIVKDDEDKLRVNYFTRPIREFNSCQLVLIPLRANKDKRGNYHILLFEREIAKAIEYSQAIRIMNGCLREDSELLKMIEGYDPR